MSYKLGGLFFKTHNDLGRFRKEYQYCKHFEGLLKNSNISYVREYKINSPDKALNKVDFFIENAILVDFKAKPFITREDYYQMRRYLELVGLDLGLIVNFRQKYLKPKRVLNSKSTSSIRSIRINS